ncbi:MAG: DUF5615 family PIN-like protein [Steroidobacteraceae bacterium]
MYGAPPKVIWLNLGNASTNDVAEVLKNRRLAIEAFAAAAEEALLVLKRD